MNDDEIIEALMTMSVCDFLEAVKKVTNNHLDNINYYTINDLKINGSSGNGERELLQLHYALDRF